MRSLRPRLTYSNVISTACLFLLLGGGAWAAASASRSSIHACYSKSGGRLRIAKHCRHNEKSLSWNKAGEAGKTGPAGAPGAAGAIGPSDVFADGTAFAALTASFQTFGTINVPPGSYLVEGKAIFFSTAAGSEAECILGPLGAPQDAANVTAGNANANTMSMSFVATYAATQELLLRCRFLSGSGNIDDAKIVAIKTQTLHGSTPVD
jgi:hypothetical protein